MAGRHLIRVAAFGAAMALAGCEDGMTLPFQRGGDDETPVNRGSTDLIERDVEAPEIFEAREPGLWDGRPSLGGVWVAHPDVAEPERVIIRNTTNDAFVIGALFRREREIPGPRLQVSSDAAEALGMLAGAPAELSVIALRREEVAPAPEPEALPDDTLPLPLPEAVAAEPLDPIDAAAGAIDAAEAGAEIDPPTPAADPAVAAVPEAAVAAAPAPQASSLDKPFIQVGIFSVEANAERAANLMRNAGIVPTVVPGESQGGQFLRVTVGPASAEQERDALLESVKDQGFTDAYFVTN